MTGLFKSPHPARLAPGLAALCLIAAPALAAPVSASRADQPGPVCVYSGVAFSGAFPAGRLNGCRRDGAHAFTLTIEPEDADINPSPWYAVEITSDAAQTLRLTLDYGGYKHRYAPKIEHQDGVWTPLDSEITLQDGDTEAVLTLPVPAGVIKLAGQQIISPENDAKWIENTAQNTDFEAKIIGKSSEGRPLRALFSGENAPETVIITGRQHPPEVTGAYALRDFVERVGGNDALARRFRSQFGLLIVPMLNPDGVSRGHWRHDTSGIDLNRDWGPFTAPETRAVRDAINARKSAGSAPALVLDFHSTWRDVLYTQPDEAGSRRAWFPKIWHKAINNRLDGGDIERSAGHNPGKPTLKSWAFETYNIPAITYEMGDKTSQARIKTAARIAAEEMMTLLLDGENAASGD